jgi:hypothetical protein
MVGILVPGNAPVFVPYTNDTQEFRHTGAPSQAPQVRPTACRQIPTPVSGRWRPVRTDRACEGVRMQRKPKPGPGEPRPPHPRPLPAEKDKAPDPVDRIEDEEAEPDEDDRDGLGVRPGG